MRSSIKRITSKMIRDTWLIGFSIVFVGVFFMITIVLLSNNPTLGEKLSQITSLEQQETEETCHNETKKTIHEWFYNENKTSVRICSIIDINDVKHTMEVASNQSCDILYSKYPQHHGKGREYEETRYLGCPVGYINEDYCGLFGCNDSTHHNLCANKTETVVEVCN